MNIKIHYEVQWFSEASGNRWQHHNFSKTSKEAIKKRDERRIAEPNIRFQAIKVTTTIL